MTDTELCVCSTDPDIRCAANVDGKTEAEAVEDDNYSYNGFVSYYFRGKRWWPNRKSLTFLAFLNGANARLKLEDVSPNTSGLTSAVWVTLRLNKDTGLRCLIYL